ncbi:S-layer homology domain-containing protein [Tissierella praeacuta]|uniref:S-layer homology domain-containing protein n=1 Tax=Tissierella praeacuta TaxID=43131 RepID=UPI003DA67BC0
MYFSKTKLTRKLLSWLMIFSTVLTLLPIQAFAANVAEIKIESCKSNFGYDFMITFSNGDWINAITGVTVNDQPYTKGNSSYSVYSNTKYYANANQRYVLIGEGYSGENPATCKIEAEGYAPVYLELTKDTYTATIKKAVEETQTGKEPETSELLKPPSVEKCEAYFGNDFKISVSDVDWINSINGVSVNDQEYNEVGMSAAVCRRTGYYKNTEDKYVLVGEGYKGDDTAICRITAKGYETLVLKLDRTKHAVVTETSDSTSNTVQKHDDEEGEAQSNGSVTEHTGEVPHTGSVDSDAGISSSFAKAKLPTIVKSSTVISNDFNIIFSDGAWVEAVTSINVNGTEYLLGNALTLDRNTHYYKRIEDKILAIGEGYSGANPAICVIQATGYDDMIIELDKTTHTAKIKETGSGVPEPSPPAEDTKASETSGDQGTSNVPDGSTRETATGLLPHPNRVMSCASASNGNSDFAIRFSDEKWIKAIEAVTVGETEYYCSGSASGVWSNTSYFLNPSKGEILLGERAVKEEVPTECLIKAKGYENLKLTLSISRDSSGRKVYSAIIFGAKLEDVNVKKTLHIRLVGAFEAAVEGQEGYDAIGGASTNVQMNKNSDVEVQAALVAEGEQVTDSHWFPLKDSGVVVDGKKTEAKIEPSGSGMVAVYSPYDSSLTLKGIPKKAEKYRIYVVVTDSKGNTVKSESLPFNIYTGKETLEERLTTDGLVPMPHDKKFIYDMEPWVITQFNHSDNKVTVPKDIKAWYGSHINGTYGKLGFAVEDEKTTQTLVVPDGCSLTMVNMHVMSSVRIIVEKGGKLNLRDSIVEGIIEVNDGGSFSMNYDDYSKKFLSGASLSGQLLLNNGATLENASINSNRHYLSNGKSWYKTNPPVVTVKGDITVKGQVFIRGDEGNAYTSGEGQSALAVKNGKINISKGSVLAAYGAGSTYLTNKGGHAIIMKDGEITGEGKLIAIGGEGFYNNGGDAINGNGKLYVKIAYLEGGSAFSAVRGSNILPGKAVASKVDVAQNIIKNIKDGKLFHGVGDSPNTSRWRANVSTRPTAEELRNSYKVDGEPDINYEDGSNSEDTREDKVVKRRYNISVEANNSTYGQVTGIGEYPEGYQTTLMATPNPGYHFVAWKENGQIVSDRAIYAFTVNRTRIISAIFEADKAKKYTVAIHNGSANVPNAVADGNQAPPSNNGSSDGSSKSETKTDTPTPSTQATQSEPSAKRNHSFYSVPAEKKVKKNRNIESKLEVNKDVETVKITEEQLDYRVQKALDTAKKNKTEQNGINIEIKANTKSNRQISFQLTKEALDKAVESQVRELKLNSGHVVVVLNQNALKEIQEATHGDIKILVKPVDNDKLSKEAAKVINKRPVYDLSIVYSKGNNIHKFGKGRVSVSIPYTLGKGEKDSNVIAYYVDTAGKLQEIPNSVYDTENCLVSFSTDHLSVYGVGYKAEKESFTDISSHWAKESIDFVATRGLMKETGNGKFSPEKAMTRGMFVTALGRLGGADTTSKYKTSQFTDVAKDAYYFPYVEWASKNGIVKGTSNTIFAPEENITREQMAVIMSDYAKAIGFEVPKVRAESKFSDSDKISSFAKDAVKQMHMAGILSGKSGNFFEPQGTATRAQTAAVLKRFVELVISSDNAQGWTQNDSGKWMYYNYGKALAGKEYTFNASGETDATPNNLTYGSYTVKKGDSFLKISKDYNCSMVELARINGKTIFSVIYPGEVLKVAEEKQETT